MKWFLAVILATGTAIAAPVPKEAKTPTPTRFTAGTYSLLWGGVPYTATFHPDGFFTETGPGGSTWSGAWEWDGVVLRVAEAHGNHVGDYYSRWSVALSPALTGKNNNGTSIVLHPLPAQNHDSWKTVPQETPECLKFKSPWW